MTQSSLEYQKRPKKHRARNILLITAVVAVVSGSLAFGFWYIRNRARDEMQAASNAFNATSTPVAEYPQRLAEWQKSGLMNHFPATIPGHATNVGFYQYPGTLQGRGDFELRLQLPPAEIASIEASAQKLSKPIPQEDQALPWFRVLGGTPNVPITNTPAGYTTYFMYQSKSADDENGAGITISPSMNTVIYWALWR